MTFAHEPVRWKGSWALAVLLLVAPGPLSAQTIPAPLPVSTLEQLNQPARRPEMKPVTRLATDAELDGPRTLSVNLAGPTPLRALLQLLVRGTPFSTVTSSSLDGTFSGELRNVTLRQALEAVLFPSGLDYDVRGTVIRVFRRRPTTRFFPIDVLAIRRTWQSRAAAPGRVVSSADSDPLAEIDNGVRGLLSAEGRHYVDRQAGIVHATDFSDRLDQIALYLETVHLRSSRQVRIDARIIRVALKAEAAMLPSPPALVRDVSQFLLDLERFGTLETIAAPQLLTLNNQAAFVQVSSSGGEEHVLVVTPQISADGIVQLSVVPRIVEKSTGSDSQSRDSVTEADSIIRVQPRESAVISGLPYPTSSGGRAEVLVLLTPSIVVPSAAQAGLR